MNILALNVGSSSLKFDVYEARGAEPARLLEGSIDTRGDAQILRYRGKGAWSEHRLHEGDHADALEALMSLQSIAAPDAVAHRVVHGGPWLREHCVIDAQVLSRIEAAANFAPLHVPPALAWIRRAARAFPHASQVACFDTAFHHPLPELSRVLPVPRELLAKGVERFGFHGLSCESILRQLDGAVPERLVIAHLGSGASVTAVQDGRSVDTSMGLTPTGGIIMGTRPGDLDPGVMLFLLRQGHCTPDQLEDLLEHRSGLRGISGFSADVRELAEASDHPSAALALAQFARSVAKGVAAMAVIMGGIDALVFTGGIGEHHAPTREHVMTLLHPCFPSLASHVLPSQENLMMARHAVALLA
ncbi:MAG TPA: acetate kinase [Dyella sp.]|uniref:acetate/propionate family kinase n=1 Tax=Dyella sp. TaxID=1869338 RepID=UPI002D7931DC|nr:acetate kinase [Dyella sp.]HET6555275.1 acetate kinase [Dyella sp.]